MKNRSRRTPPPPPPRQEATRTHTPLPALRPRRLDLPNPSARTEQQRRAVQLPEPPTDWAPDIDGLGDLPVPNPPPAPPENLRDVLKDLTRTYSRPAPPAETGNVDAYDPPKPASLAGRPEPKDSAKRLNVPIICTQTDRPFVLVFRETRSIFGTRYKLETTLANVGEGGNAAPSLTVPISSLDWGGITCPHCRNHSRVRPVFCGNCNRLACDGRVKTEGEDLFFECAPSCGTSGWVRGGLQTVTGSEGSRSAPRAASNSFVCTPETPPGIAYKLLKPR